METRHKFSRKRQAILDYLQTTYEHPSAEMIYNSLKSEIPDLSLATVYRNLASFQKEGMVSVAANVFGNDRYDAIINPHPHFICSRCGEITDLNGTQMLEEAITAIAERNQLNADYYTVNIYGCCSKCRSNVNTRESGF